MAHVYQAKDLPDMRAHFQAKLRGDKVIIQNVNDVGVVAILGFRRGGIVAYYGVSDFCTDQSLQLTPLWLSRTMYLSGRPAFWAQYSEKWLYFVEVYYACAGAARPIQYAQ